MSIHRVLGGVALATALLSVGACADGDDPLVPEAPARYTVEVSGEHFTVEVKTNAQVKDMEARLKSKEPGVINGKLLPGSGGYNAPWSWRLDPATVEVVDMAIEVCDGRPSMVEQDLSYWLNTVQRFCPWGAKVVAREP